MQRAGLQQYDLPDAPGVYFFLGENKQILYIGKATSVKNRVRSYFASDLHEKRSELIEQMVREAVEIEWTETDSVLEALILETNLIRTHKPKYNTRSKDDKSYNHLVITNEEWPRVLVVRGKDLTERFEAENIKYHFGPFPSGQLFREALKIVRRIFKFYDTKTPVGEERSKLTRGQIDFNRQIGLYPDRHSHDEYQKTIRHLRLFFQGKKKILLRELEREMMRAAREERFEDAALRKKQIFALQHINDVALIKADSYLHRDERAVRIEGYDIAHTGGTAMVGVMTVVENEAAQPSEYRTFKIKRVKKSNDPAALREVLERRLTHPEWPYPQVVVVDGGKAQKNVAELVLRQHGLLIPVVGVVKDERHRPRDILAEPELRARFEQAILLANAESHRFALAYHRRRRSRQLRA